MSWKTVAIFFLCFSAYSKEIFTESIGGIMVDFLGYSFFSAYFLLRLKDLKFNRSFFFFMLATVVYTILVNLFLNFPFGPFIKQLIPICLIFFACYDLIYRLRFDMEEVVHVYIQITYFAALFGLFQYIFAYATGIRIYMGIIGYLDSITYEPSHYGAVAVPGLVLASIDLKRYRVQAIVILISIILTFSTTPYIVLILIFLISRLKFFNLLILLPTFYLVYIGLIVNINEKFNSRYVAMKSYLESGDAKRNGTVISLMSNLDVATGTLKKGLITGAGLGGHENMYKIHYEGTEFEDDYFYELNIKSGHSLTVRIFSEFGLVGLLAFIIFLISRHVPKEQSKFHNIVYLACISHFISKSFKLGGYIDYGTPIFFTLIIVNLIVFNEKKALLRKRIEEELND